MASQKKFMNASFEKKEVKKDLSTLALKFEGSYEDLAKELKWADKTATHLNLMAEYSVNMN